MTTPVISDPVQIGFTTGKVSTIWGRGIPNSPPIALYNQDANNTVTIGFSQAFNITDTNTIPLAPLQSVVISGQNGIWARAISGTKPLISVPGGAQFMNGNISISGPVTATISGPVAIETLSPIDVSAATVDIAGVGGFVLSGQLATVFKNAGSINAAAGASVNSGPFAVSNYSSILFNILAPTNSSGAAGAAICATFLFQWLDGSGNILSQSDIVSVLIGANITVRIPVKGTQLIVVLLNNGAVGTISCPINGMVVWGDYRLTDEIEILSWSQSAVPAFIGFTTINPVFPASVVREWIANVNEPAASLVINTSYIVLMPVWRGNVQGWFQQATNALAHNATIIDLTFAVQNSIGVGTGYVSGILQNLPSAVSASAIDFMYNSPPTQLAFMFQTGAALGATFLMLTGDK